MVEIVAPRRSARRASLLHRCADVVAARGLRTTSIADIAREIGMSKSGVFAHFRSKEELDASVVDALATRLRMCLADAVVGTAGTTLLRALIVATAAEMTRTGKDTCVLTLAVRDIEAAPPLVAARLATILDEWRASVGDAFAASVAAAGGAQPSDVERQRFSCHALGICVACGLLGRLGSDAATARDNAAAEIDALLRSHGLGEAPARA